MKFHYPVDDVRGKFQNVEYKGMQALAVGATKEAAKHYDRAILADPSIDAIQRVVQQYVTAGHRSSKDYSRYWHFLRHAERFHSGKDEYGNFHYGLELMRKKHGGFLKEQQRQALIQADPQAHEPTNSSRTSPPPYDDINTEQSAILKSGKPSRQSSYRKCE